MKQWLSKLLDEENRTADLTALGQVVALMVSVLFSGAVLSASTYYAYKTGKLDSNALWLIGFWIGCAFGLSTADKLKMGGKSPVPVLPMMPTATDASTKPTPPNKEGKKS